jgi:hypothetical protein
MEFEYPNIGGTLWSSGKMTGDLHTWFLRNPIQFAQYSFVQSPQSLGDRISINAISWMGSDFQHMGDLFRSNDDEHILSVYLPQKLGRHTAIYGPFIVSHLSFFKQEEDEQFKRITVPVLLKEYDKRAEKETSVFHRDHL